MAEKVIINQSGYWATATFTAAAAAYSAGDVMGGAQTLTWRDATGAIFTGGELFICTTELILSETGLQSSEGAYTLQKYSVTPPSAYADNDAWDLPAGDIAAYTGCGPTSLGTPVDVGTSCYIKQNVVNEQIRVTSTGLTFAYLQTVAGFTATAKARTVLLRAVSL